MGKHVRVNGFDFDKSSRIDKTKSKKQIKGAYSNTYRKNLKQKNKVELIHRDDTEALFNMLTNPQIHNALILGEEYNEEQIIDSFRYKPSIGDINFATLNSSAVNRFAILNEEDLINRNDWEWIIDEPFRSTADSPAGAWVDNVNIPAHTLSGGDDLQSKDIDWHEYAGSILTTTALSVEGDQCLQIPNLDYIRLQLGKLYNNYELSCYVRHSSASGIVNLMFGFNGYDTTTDIFSYLRLKFGLNEIDYYHGYSLGEMDYTLLIDTWYYVKVRIIGKHVSVYINDEFIFEVYDNELTGGDIAFYSNNSSMYLDKVRMKVLPTSIIPSPSLSTSDDKDTVNSSVGSQERVFNQNELEINPKQNIDSQLLFDFKERNGNILHDKINSNDAIIRNGSWTEDGMLGYGVELNDGDIIVVDDSSISELSEFNLHMRFRLKNLAIDEIFSVNPIITKGHEFGVYDMYSDHTGTWIHHLVFEIYGELLIGDSIIEDEWVESWFLSDGKNSFIYRRDLVNQVIIAEARKVFGDVVGYIPLDNETVDYSSYGHSVTPVSIVYTDGQRNRAVNFDGVNDYIILDNDMRNLIVTEDNQCSIAMWINPTSLPSSGAEYIVGHSATGNRLYLSVTATYIQAVMGDNNDNAQYNTTNTGSWMHVVATYNNWTGEIKLYINGQLEDTGTGNVFSSASTTNLTLGALNPSPLQLFDGKMDDVYIYKKVITIEEVKYLYNKGNYTHDLNMNSEGYDPSENILQIDYVNLQDKFYMPFKHIESLIQVRAWELLEDSIANPNMSKLLLHAPFDEGDGAYSKVKNVYGSNVYFDQVSLTIDEWTNDTYSLLKANSILCDVGDWISGATDQDDLRNEIYIYQTTISFWVKFLESSSGSVLETMGWSGTAGIYLVMRTDANGSYIQYGNGSNNQVSLLKQYPINKWLKFDLTFVNGVTKVYIDGELEITSDDSATFTYFTRSPTDYVLDQPLKRNTNDLKIYERALTASEIKESFICDPLTSYYLQPQIFSPRQNIDKNSTVFIENGLFGIKIHKQIKAEALKDIGKVELLYFDKGWELVGELRTYDLGNTDGNISVKDYKILEMTPLKQVVRVWFEGDGLQLSGYQGTSNDRGYLYAFDFTLEAGKFGVTIIPRFIAGGELYMYLRQAYYSSVKTDVGIAGFKDVNIGELTGIGDVTCDIPLALTLRKSDNLIIGFGSNKLSDAKSIFFSSNNTTTDDNSLAGIRFIEDDINNYVFTIFAKKYYVPNGNDLTLFVEAEDAFGFSLADPLASGGNVYSFSSGLKVENMGNASNGLMKKGTYMSIVRLKQSSGTVQLKIYKSPNVIESYGYNIGISDTFTPSTLLTNYFTPFVVDDETATYYWRIDRIAGTISVDYLMVIPLSNGKDGVMDLYHQGLSISNNKYIGNV